MSVDSVLWLLMHCDIFISFLPFYLWFLLFSICTEIVNFLSVVERTTFVLNPLLRILLILTNNSGILSVFLIELFEHTCWQFQASVWKVDHHQKYICAMDHLGDDDDFGLVFGDAVRMYWSTQKVDQYILICTIFLK